MGSGLIMRKKTTILIMVACLFILVLVFGIIFYSPKIKMTMNERNLIDAIHAYQDEDTQIFLTDVTPFEWDSVYFFAPYTSVEQIYNATGYNWRFATISVNEGTMQIVFLKNEKVICYLRGYPSTNGYYIDCAFDHYSTAYTVLYAKNNPRFSVTCANNYIELKYIE